MDFWSIVVFIVASYLALRSLVTLLARYRQLYASQFLIEELQRRAEGHSAAGPQTERPNAEDQNPQDDRPGEPTSSKAA